MRWQSCVPMCVLALALAFAVPASAQQQLVSDHVIVVENAPLFSSMDATLTPLRVAAKGSALLLIHDGGEWIQIQFLDPKFGLRLAWMQARFARIERGVLRPINLSVPGASSSTPGQAATRPSDAAPAAPGTTPTLQLNPGQPGADVPRPTRVGRHGVWASLGAGFGSAGCDTCIGRDTGGIGDFGVGGTLGQHLYLGLGSSGFYKAVAIGSVRASTLDARLRIYPSRHSGGFITFGLGVGIVGFQIGRLTYSETGAGAVVGVGWDIPVGHAVNLTPFWNGMAVSTTSINANFEQVGLAVTVHQ